MFFLPAFSPLSPYLHQLVLRQRRRAHHRRETPDKLRNQPELDEKEGEEEGEEEGEPPMLVHGAVCATYITSSYGN